MVGIEALAATPDAPANRGLGVFLAADACLRLIGVRQTGRRTWLCDRRLAAGFGLLSKYTALFFGLRHSASRLDYALPQSTTRKWLLSPWPYLNGAALALSSVRAGGVSGTATHDWISFALQFGRAAARALDPMTYMLANFSWARSGSPRPSSTGAGGLGGVPGCLTRRGGTVLPLSP